MGDRLCFLQAAVNAIDAIDDLVAVSGVYETDPVGGPQQGLFLNVVAQLSTGRLPRNLLELCQQLETSAGRVREVRWGPRTLDADVLWVEGETADEPDLIVPHPRMLERAFVMVPLGELAPDLVAGWVNPGIGDCRRLGDWDQLAIRTGEGSL